MNRLEMLAIHEDNTTASVTHLLWAGRWIEVIRVAVDVGSGPEPAWRFKSGRDAADWLRWTEDDV